MQRNSAKKLIPPSVKKTNQIATHASYLTTRLSQLTISLWHAYQLSSKIGSTFGIAAIATGLMYPTIATADVTIQTPPTTPAKTNTTSKAADVSTLDNVNSDKSNDQPVIRSTPVASSTANAVDTTTDQRVDLVAPTPQPQSARTRPNFTQTAKQEASLERLKQYYQKNPDLNQSAVSPTQSTATAETDTIDTTTKLTDLNTPADSTQTNKHKTNKAATHLAMCYGTWVYPQNTGANTPEPYKQNALNAAKTDQPNSAFPVYAQADYGYYDNNNYAELAGNVFVNQGRQQIAADKVVVNLQDGVAAAQGNVMLVDVAKPDANANNTTATLANSKTSGGIITVADEIAYQTDSTKATAKDVAFASVPLQAHGYAKQLNKVDESHYEIDDVMFTTCAPDNPSWQINAKNLDINTETGRGKVYNATFKIKNKPIFYLPYFNFPINDQRASGFLLPKAGFTSDGGLNLQTPYYLNLAPNYDLTLTPRIYTNRNPMLTGEFRYLTDDYGQGNLTASYLPSDRQYDHQDRSSMFFNHTWHSKSFQNLSAEAVYEYVSDSAYLNDFDTLGSLESKLNLPRRIQAHYFNDYITALAKVESFQTLSQNLTNEDEVLDKDKPYKRLPQLSLRYQVPQNLLPWDLPIQVTGISDFAYFKRPIRDDSAPEQSGGRLYNKITATYPLSRPWGYLTPAVSLQHLYTQYDEDSTIANNLDKNNKSSSIFVPEFSLDTGLNFYKTGSPLKNSKAGGYQLISPRLKYVYAPYRDQTDVPNFNTRLASLNFPQLYENSWFLGYDRLADSNYLTPSVNYRYVDSQGLTRLDASIGQQFYLGDIKVHLDNTNNPIKLDSSGTVLQLSSQPRENFWVDLDGAVTDKGDLGYINTQLRYTPTNDSLYNLGYIKRNANPLGQKDLSALTASAIFPLRNIFNIDSDWRFLGAVQFDNERSRFSDVLAGFTYDSCCYGFSIYTRSYYNDLSSKDKPTRAIMAEISLNGIANKRQGRLSSLINERVLGYRDMNF